MVLRRDDWLDLARKVDWTFRYVPEDQVFPEALSGRPVSIVRSLTSPQFRAAATDPPGPSSSPLAGSVAVPPFGDADKPPSPD